MTPDIGGAAYLDVEPKGGTISGPSSGTVSTNFTVQNTGTASTTGSFTVHSDGAISNCSVSPTSKSMAVGATQSLSVSCATAITGSGSIYVDAGWPSANTDEGYVIVQLPSAKPTLTASPTTQYTAENVSTNYPSFQLTNAGNATGTYTATVTTCGGNVTGCSVHAQPPSLGVNGSASIQVDYQSGPAANGNGTITLQVTSQYGESTTASVTIVPLSESVSVSATTVPPAPQPTQSAGYGFTISATGNNTSPVTYTLSTSCTGTMSCPTTPTPSSVTITPGSPATASVNATATSNLAGGSGTVALTASYTNSWGQVYANTATVNVAVPDIRYYTPQLTPKSDSTTYNEANVATNAVFTVKNAGNAQATYTITQPVPCTGQSTGTSCVIRNGYTSLTLNAGASGTVPVDYSTGPMNQRVHITLKAQATAGAMPSDTGSLGVVPLSDTVTVAAATGAPTVLTNGSNTYNFTVTNVGNDDNVTYTLQLTGCAAPVFNCGVAGTVTLNKGQSQSVPVTYQTQGSTGTAQLALRAYVQRTNLYQASATGTITVNSRLGVSTAFMNNDDQDLSRCASSCFAVTAAKSTVPYYTLDTPRSVTLAYNSDRAFPRPFVYADVTLSAPPAGTTTYRLQVLDSASGVARTFTNKETTLTFQNSSSGGRLAGQLDFSSDTTGFYPVSIVVTAVYSDNTSDKVTVRTQLLVVNSSKPTPAAPGAFVAKGWSVAGVPRLSLQADSSAVITDGTGSALVFRFVNHKYVTPGGDFTTLTDSAGGWVRTALDNTAVWFRSNGLADRVTDRLGFATVFEYDGSNRLSKIHDPMLRKTKPGYDATVLTYGSYGLDSIQEPDPLGVRRTTKVNVGADSLLTAVVDPDGDSTSYGYDAAKRLSTTTPRNGGTTTFAYDTTWKLLRVTAPQVAIDAGGGAATLQRPTVTFSSWQSVGVPMNTTAATPAAPISIKAPTATVTNPVGGVTQITVDSAGRALTVNDPVGNQTQYGYTGPALTEASIPDGSATAGENYYTYSGAYLTSVVQAGVDTVNYHYGVAAQIDSTWGAGSLRQHMFLRNDGRPDSVQVGSAKAPRTTVYTYAAVDTLTKRPVQIADPAGHVTTYAYDPIFGNTQITTALGNRTDSLWFDAYGRDTLSKNPAIKHIVHYDAVNRPRLDSIVGNPGATHFGYAHTSTTTTDTVTDAVGNVYRSDYNVLGWKIADHSPITSLPDVTYRYDQRGLLTSTTNRRGQTIAMTYDPIGRVKTRADSAGTTTFTYSPGGFTTTAANSSFSMRTVRQLYCTSPSGHSIDQTCQNDTTVVTYNGTSYTIGHADPGNFADTATSTLDDGLTFNRQLMRDSVLGVPNTVTLGSLSMKYVYDAKDGLRTMTVLPALGTMVDSFTTNHEVYWRQYSDTTVNKTYQRAYHYDLAGRLDSYTQSHNGVSTASEIQNFAYDSAGRLASNTGGTLTCNGFPASRTGTFDANQGWQPSPTACGSPAFTQTYQYDAVGNRTHSLINGASDVPGTYTTGDRLQTMGTRSYGYDADGNDTTMSDANTGEARQYYYGASGLLDSVAVSGGSHPGTLRLGYDPYGRLAVRSWTTSGNASPSSQRLYLYDGDNVGKEIDLLNGGAATDYAYEGTDHPIMRVVHDASGNVTSTSTYLYDEIGRVEGAITNGAATAMLNYSDWGDPVGSGPTPATLRFGFKGMLYDEDVDLYYARNRWYDPKSGRFTQEDPIGLAGGINPYVFAGDDPVDGADPSGLVQATSYGACTLEAASCGDPLEFPGATDHAVGYGGDVSFAGGMSNAGYYHSVYTCPPCTDISASGGDAVSQEAVALALRFKLQKTPYVPGGTSSAGADCTGFCKAVFDIIGLGIPYPQSSTFSSSPYFRAVPISEARAGDILWQPRDNKGNGHVGIYEGFTDNNGHLIGVEMGNHGASTTSLWGPGGWFPGGDHLRVYRIQVPDHP